MRFSSYSSALALAASTLIAPSQAVYYKIDTPDNIKQSANMLAYDLSVFYSGNKSGNVVGILPGPPPNGDYYWYVAGAMFGTYIDYWHMTGDTSYNQMVMDGMLAQVGDDQDYQPKNWSLSLGNDDQAHWAMAALSAAETKFPNPPKDKPQWIDLAHKVWERQNDRQDDECGGGLHWQVFRANKGFDYKNVISNACFMNIGGRLARYTGNETFANVAEATWQWMWNLEYIDHEKWMVYDGGHTGDQCKVVEKTTFSTNGAVLIEAIAYLYNFTDGKPAQKQWGDRLDNLLDRYLINNFKDSISFEPNCEPNDLCKTDQKCSKGFVHRWLSNTMQMAPHTIPKIQPVLAKSVQAAVNQCIGAPTGRRCGFDWTTGYRAPDEGPSGTTGACEAMNVLGAVSSMLVFDSPAPVTLKQGGLSNSSGDIYGAPTNREFKPITTGDKAGAGIVTILLLGLGLLPLAWIAMP